MRLLNSFFLFFFCLSTLIAQDHIELQKQKKQLLKEIKQSNQILKQTQKDKDLSLNQLKGLKQKIEIRLELISAIEKELRFIKEETQKSLNEKKILETELKEIKKNYATLVRHSYKSSKRFNVLLFLFSSRNFQQAYKRLTFIKEISEYRKKQVQKIQLKKELIDINISRLNRNKKIKERLINEKKSEKKILDNEKKIESIGLSALSEKEEGLKQLVSQKKKKKEKIEKEIQRIIEDDIRKKTNNNKFSLTPEAISLSKNFTSNQSLLPWPVSKGLVISKFGKQKHPILKEVVIENNGIEIATEKNSTCRAIFDGVVSSILIMPNGTKVVMIRHGEYISVYSNLSEVFVSNGDNLKTKDILGLVFTSLNGKETVLDFQLWRGAEKVNPILWLKKK